MAQANGGQPAAQQPSTSPQAPFPVSNAPNALPGQLDMGLAGNTPAAASGNFGIAQPSDPSNEVKAMLDDFFGGQS